jgi:hypothetical protein
MKSVRFLVATALFAVAVGSPVLGREFGFDLIEIANAGSLCSDGWMSSSQGSGTCSWHGGISGGGSSSGSRGSFSQPTFSPPRNYSPTYYVSPPQRLNIQPIERRPAATISPIFIPAPIIKPTVPMPPIYNAPSFITPPPNRLPNQNLPKPPTSPSKPFNSTDVTPQNKQVVPVSNRSSQGLEPALLLTLVTLFGGAMFFIGNRSASPTAQPALRSTPSRETKSLRDSDQENANSAREVSDK